MIFKKAAMEMLLGCKVKPESWDNSYLEMDPRTEASPIQEYDNIYIVKGDKKRELWGSVDLLKNDLILINPLEIDRLYDKWMKTQGI
jgi:hypothetical protein